MSTASRIELMISDVDGTLVDHDKKLAPATIAAVRRLHEVGIGFTLISSRPPMGLCYPVRTLGVELPYAAFNGGTLIGTGGALLASQQMESAAARQTIELFRQRGVETWAYADGDWMVLDADGAFVPRERRTLDAEPVVVASFEPYVDRIDKIVAASDDHAGLADIEAELAKMLGARARAVRSQPYYLDVTAPQASKGLGIAALAERIGVPLSRVAVIGDAHNDIPMFERAALAIAMGQAEEAVKAAAHEVTGSNGDAGVAEAIERFILPRAPR